MCALHHLAKPPTDSLTLAGGEAGRIVVWSVDPPRQVTAFPAIFAGVLGRLACGYVDGRHVVVAAELHRGRLAGYDAQSGAQLWLRSDLPPVQDVALTGREQVAVAFLRSRALLVDLATGETTATGLRWRSLHTFEGVGLSAANFDGYAAIVDPWAARKLWRIPDGGLGVLGVAGDRMAVLSIAGSSRADGLNTRSLPPAASLPLPPRGGRIP